MNRAQKVIKYFAIVLAISIICSIVTSIVVGISAILGITEVINFVNNSTETVSVYEEYTGVDSIEIDVSSAVLEIIPSESLKVEGEGVPKDYTFKQNNTKLEIEGKKSNTNTKITVYVPSNTKKLDLTIGAGNVDIKDITLDTLNLEIGAAKTTLTNVISIISSDIDTGIGEVIITNSNMHNLEMNTGVGSVNFEGTLTGKSNVDCGIGNLKLNLIGADYKIIAERGIGNLNINGNTLSGEQVLGTGSNVIEISGGIGNIDVTY